MNNINILKRLYNDYTKNFLGKIALSVFFSLIVASSTSSIAWLLDPAIKKIFIQNGLNLKLAGKKVKARTMREATKKFNEIIFNYPDNMKRAEANQYTLMPTHLRQFFTLNELKTEAIVVKSILKFLQ